MHDEQPDVAMRGVIERLRNARQDLEPERPPQGYRGRVRLHDRVELNRPEAIRARPIEHMLSQRAAHTQAGATADRP